MSNTYEARLQELGITLPDAPASAANYVPYVISGDLVFISGQISAGPDGLITGKLGDDMDVEAGRRVCKFDQRLYPAASGGERSLGFSGRAVWRRRPPRPRRRQRPVFAAGRCG